MIPKEAIEKAMYKPRLCEIPDCGVFSHRVTNFVAAGIGICDRHRYQVKKYGRTLSQQEAEANVRAAQLKAGVRPWNYKGGRYTLNMVVRRCVKYKAWVRAIFERDNFTCQKCQVRGFQLEADHFPVRFSVLMDKHNIKTYEEALACEPLWDINNGRTLCKPCHRNIKL